ncbi:hypothetical protein I302_107917 [Kwoniella bestiolae CBS 10118]|uniref:Calcineurin-like phosphoesterase domain-containing protein n=1 Tax=Kwoniella bestiolae CBS 10118 TaxID=1296100 RepID=A0AAJ8KDK1_9TREE
MWSQIIAASWAFTACAAAPLLARNFPAGQCVVDVKIETCGDFNCKLDGYHRIDAFLTQRIEANEIKVIEEGKEAPEGTGWYPAPHSAHEGVTDQGGPTLWSRRDYDLQQAGKVVDLVVVRPGRWANSTEDFVRSSVNLGLGEAAGAVAFEDYREYDSVSSGWIYLEYTVAGPRDPITDVQVVACSGDSVGAHCGNELLGKGWKRRDTDLNGPTANGSHIYIFTTTQLQTNRECVTSLKVVDDENDKTVSVNLNDGTTGDELYLEVTKARDEDCITSIRPIDTSRYFAEPWYDVVTDSNGQPADVNAGIGSADPIFIYTSKLVERPRKEPIKLSFSSDGTFRIALFSDLHHSHHSAICRDVPEQIEADCSEEYSFAFMGAVLDHTEPDLVVIDGDLYAENDRKQDKTTYPQLTDGAIVKAIRPIIERGIPFAVTYGNHDAEGSLLREEIQRAMDIQPGFVGSRGLNQLDGIGNYKLDITKSKDSEDIAHRLWFFDSRSYTYFGNGTNSGDYGRVEQSQVDWYSANADASINAMAFFHIPVAQISDAIGLNTTARIGVHGESVCPQGNGCSNTPKLDDPYVSLFDAFVNAGDVKATFSGHDHSNDYIIEAQGIQLTYDGSAGYTAYSAGDANYNREMRVIDVAEHGKTVSTFKIIDDILAGTVHRNESEPIVTLF